MPHLISFARREALVLCLAGGLLLAAPQLALATPLLDEQAPSEEERSEQADSKQAPFGTAFSLDWELFGVPRISGDQAAATEERQRLFSLSALGTDPGHTVTSLGGRLKFVESGFFLPTFDFHLVATQNELLDIEFRGWSLGILNWLEGGVRLSARGEAVSVGLRANGLATFLLIGGESAFVGIFGLLGGGFASFGTSQFQATIGLDVPMPFIFTAALGSNLGSASAFTVMLRPNVAFEFPIGKRSNLYLLLSVLLTAEDDDFPPIFSLSAGVTF